jgi:hypothetical protein
MLLGDKALGGLVVYLRLLGFLAANRRRIGHQPSQPYARGELLPRSKSVLMLLKARECSKAAELKGKDMNTLNTHTRAERILLSGASGMLGSALRAALAQRGDSVVQLVRRVPVGPEELQWDPAGASPLVQAETLEGFDAVVHLSGANLAARRWTPDYRREIVASRVDSTRALAGVLAGLRQPPRAFLAASAIGFYGDRGD